MNKEKENCEHYFACALCGEEQNVSDLLKKQRMEIDIGDSDYYMVRHDVAKLSGIGAMAVSFKEHLKVIEGKLKTLNTK